MTRSPMLKRSALQSPAKPSMTTRAALNSGVPGYIASVVDGPQSLIWRSTEEDALRDGAEYVAEHYKQSFGVWVPK